MGFWGKAPTLNRLGILWDIHLKNITKKNGWNFNWKSEFQDIQKEVYKLTIVNNPSIIQGILSISIFDDHVYMNLLESAPFNIGKNKTDKALRRYIGSIPFQESKNDN